MVEAEASPPGGTRPSPEELVQLLRDASRALESHRRWNVPLVRADSVGRAVFVGDTEGKVGLTREVLRRYLEDGTTTVVFLGDYVDRGPYQVENVSELLRAARQVPERLILLRGNHETNDVRPHDFFRKMEEAYGPAEGAGLCRRIMGFFSRLPYAAVVGNCFCVHGGIPEPVPYLEDLETLRLGLLAPYEELQERNSFEVQLLWNDPDAEGNPARLNTAGFRPNLERGAGRVYGEKAVDEFLRQNQLARIVRGHERVAYGLKLGWGGKVVTLNETGTEDDGRMTFQALLHLEAGGCRAEILPSFDHGAPTDEARELSARASRELTRVLSSH